MAIIEPLIRSALKDPEVLLDLTVGLLITLLLLCTFLCMKTIIKNYVQLPPGPCGYPIFGMLPLINKEFHLLLFDFSKIYGKIFSLKMGQETLVVLTDPTDIKTAFRGRDFIARPKSELSNLLNGYGVINSEGALWKSQRRYLKYEKLGLRTGDMGSSLLQIESCVATEVTNMLDVILNSYAGKSFDPAFILNSSIANVICTITMSWRFRHDDPKFQRFMFLFDEGFRLFNDTGAMTFIPILKYMPGVKNTCQKLRENREEMLQFVRDIIDQHKTTLDRSQPRDLVDKYLIGIEEHKNNKPGSDIFHGFDPDSQLEQVLLDLFSAGVETLKTSMLWSICYMLHYPEVKAKVQKELDEVVGPKRLPSIEDMKSLPYTQATLCEVLRRSSVVPMGTTHATDREVKFAGYTLPKNTHVIPLLHAVHMDPENWEEPESFRPERFLSEDGTETVKPLHFMPFGTGQRQCLGDKLAQNEFFLFFSSLLHTFDISLPQDANLPSLHGLAGVTVTPKEFDIVCSSRHIEALVLTKQTLSSVSHLLPTCRSSG